MEKYTSSDFNTRYIINLLERDNKWDYIEDIKFRISETSEVQFLHILNNIIYPIFSKNTTLDMISLTIKHLDVFFYFGHDSALPYPSVSKLEFRCMQTFCFEDQYNAKYQVELDQLIKTLRFKLKTETKLEYFNDAIYGTNENPIAEFNRISVIEFLIKALEYNLFKRKKLEATFGGKTENINNYNIKVSNSILEKLYSQLEKHQFIDIEKTSNEDFCKVLKSEWHTHYSLIHLNMDNIQTNLLFKTINEFLSIDIKITSLEKARNIRNKNGFIKSKSIYTSVSKSHSLPKNSDVIIDLIKKVKM
ncbi:hypothetical protein [uncultured Tenacibaculum sp.]|uniref:hypothetical protein n=1 Tax=uncultured Tenacibaculum sp. TaxID=174713 RepID=UPI00261D0D03|nr:hypothetical protein [uncultured Tenacibaculum sp.]